MISNNCEDARLWLFLLFETTSQHDRACILVTLWSIWWARRRAIHDNEFQSAMTTWCFNNRYLEDLEIASARQPNALNARPAQHVPRWLSPVGSAAKFNVDVGLSRHGAAAVICEDSSDRFVGASAVVFDGLFDATSLEAHACNEVVALAKDLNIHCSVIASDCLEFMTNINKGAALVHAIDQQYQLKIKLRCLFLVLA